MVVVIGDPIIKLLGGMWTGNRNLVS